MIVNLPADAVPGPLLLYGTDARDDVAPAEATLSAMGDGKWSAQLDGFVGRFWPTVEYSIGTDPHRVDLPYWDLPYAPELIVTPEYVAKRAKMSLPLTEDQRETVLEAILDAQSDVVTFLGRAIVPTLYTESGRYDNGRGHWNLTPLDDPVIEVVDVTPDTLQGQPTGTFTITYRAGLNAKEDEGLRAIRRYVTAAAMNAPEFIRMWRDVTKAKGEIKSVTTEGQSITYDSATLGGGGQPGSGSPGSLPDIASLDYWRVAGRRAYQRETVHHGPWPYVGYSGRSWS